MAWAPLAMMLVSTVMSAEGEKQSAEAHAADLNRQADVLDSQRTDVYAQGLRNAAEQRRKGDMVLGDARAAMVASGGVSTDAGALDTLGKIDREAEYNRLGVLFDSNMEQYGMKRNAAILRAGGNAIQSNVTKNYATTVISGAAQAYAGYKSANPGGGYKSSAPLTSSSPAPMSTYYNVNGTA